MNQFIKSLVDRVVDAASRDDVWACGEYPSEAGDAVQLLPLDIDPDDTLLEFIQLLIDAAKQHEKLRRLCEELDAEMDGVKCPQSAAGILNAIRDAVHNS